MPLRARYTEFSASGCVPVCVIEICVHNTSRHVCLCTRSQTTLYCLSGAERIPCIRETCVHTTQCPCVTVEISSYACVGAVQRGVGQPLCEL